MADDLGPVQPGERVSITASARNAWSEAARAHRRGKLGRTGDGVPSSRSVTPAVEVLVRNDVGADLEAGEIVGIAGIPVVSAIDHPNDVRRRPAQPATAPVAGKAIAILSEPIPAGEIGRAVVQGVALTTITGTGEYCNANPDETAKLYAGTAGPARVLWSASGAGVRTALVLLHGGESPTTWLATITAIGTDGVGSAWSWQRVDRIGTADPTIPAAGTLNAYPIGVYAAGVDLSTGNVVEMWRSAGVFLFRPVQYATATLPGLLSAAAQEIGGPKTFKDRAIVAGDTWNSDTDGLSGNPLLDVNTAGKSGTAVRVKGRDGVELVRVLTYDAGIGYIVLFPVVPGEEEGDPISDGGELRVNGRVKVEGSNLVAMQQFSPFGTIVVHHGFDPYGSPAGYSPGVSGFEFNYPSKLRVHNGIIWEIEEATGTFTGTNTGDQNLFSKVEVDSQPDVTANSTTTALTLSVADGILLATDNTAKSLAFSLGNITPTSVNSNDINGIQFVGTSSPFLAVSGISSVSNVNTGDQNVFASIEVSGQTTVTPGSTTQALTLAAGSGVTITTNNTTKTITFAASGGGGGLADGDYTGVTVSSGGTVIEINESYFLSLINPLITGGDVVINVNSIVYPTGYGPLTDGDKTHVTVSGDGTIFTINNGVLVTTMYASSSVTYAKIQNVSATDKVLGRATAGAGQIEEITFTPKARDLAAETTAAGMRGVLGATTAGSNFFVLTNPAAIGYSRVSAAGVVDVRTYAQVLSDIGAQAASAKLTAYAGLTTSGYIELTSGTPSVVSTIPVADIAGLATVAVTGLADDLADGYPESLLWFDEDGTPTYITLGEGLAVVDGEMVCDCEGGGGGGTTPVTCIECHGTAAMGFDDTGFPAGGAPFAVSFWARCDTSSGVLVAFAVGQYPNAENTISIYQNSGSVWFSHGTDGVLSGTGWGSTRTHVVATYDGTNWELFKDGVSIGTSTATLNLVIPGNNGTIGGTIQSTGGYYWDGGIADVRVYDGPPSGAEITALFNSGQPNPAVEPVVSVNKLHHWKFDEGSGPNAVDSTGGAHAFAIGSGLTWGTL